MGRPKKEQAGEEVANIQDIKNDNPISESFPKNKVKLSNLNDLKNLLDKNPEDHLNYEEEVYYRVSTGSLMWDMQLGGGLVPGLVRFGGKYESGKTSAALEVARNFINLHKENGRVLYIKAESRLSQEMKKRCGLKFVTNLDEWSYDSIFVLESNVYEFIINTLRACVYNNPENIRYLFILDSMDSLMSKTDKAKPIEEAGKVASNASLSKKMLQQIADKMAKCGHIFLPLSQHTADLSGIMPYSPKEPRPMGSSGGNALSHWASFMFEFLQPTKNQKIYDGDKVIGHICRIKFCKSTNEKKDVEIDYPVKYGVCGGSSVWQSKEISDFALANGLIKKAGAWFKVDESFRKELRDAGFEIEEQFQGSDKISTWLDKNPEVMKFLYEKFKKIALVG